jgi:hypothetical protein
VSCYAVFADADGVCIVSWSVVLSFMTFKGRAHCVAQTVGVEEWCCTNIVYECMLAHKFCV